MCLKRLQFAGIVVAVLGFLAGPLNAGPKAKELDRLARQTLRNWKLVGLSVAVLHNKKPLLVKGYGYRDLQRKMKVDSKTLFSIGSTTKAFTAALVGMLVDDGKLAWNKPVRTWLPEFKLMDRFASARITPLDLMLHNSGLPRHDLVWYGSSFTGAELMRRLRFLKPTADFRVRFQYNNLMFLAAGYLSARVSGKPWGQLLRERILSPLGMLRSTPELRVQKRDPNHALPYGPSVKGKHKRFEFRRVDNVAPAGSIASNAEEMARWATFLLNRGKIGEKRLISKKSFARLFRPGMLMPNVMKSEVKQIRRRVTCCGYAPGWVAMSYRGRMVFMHTGSIDGFRAAVFLVPESGDSVVLMSNTGGNASWALRGLGMKVLDRLFGEPPLPWDKHYSQRLKRASMIRIKMRRRVLSFKGKQNARQTHPLSAYVGSYNHPGYGTIEIILKDGALRLVFNSFRLRLAHVHYNVFRLVGDHPFLRYLVLTLNFGISSSGSIDRLATWLERQQKQPMVFRRLKLPKSGANSR